MDVKNIQVYTTPSITSPLLYGMVSPKILLPEKLTNTLSHSEIKHVFLHELAHYKRNDIQIAWMTTLLQIVHWFNPLIWFAFYKMRLDREKACDEMSLSKLEGEKPQIYGRTIISLLENVNPGFRTPVTVGIVDTNFGLQGRLKMIKNYTKKSYWWTLFAILLITSIGTMALTDADIFSSLKNSKWTAITERTTNGIHIYITNIDGKKFNGEFHVPKYNDLHEISYIEGTVIGEDSLEFTDKYILFSPYVVVNETEHLGSQYSAKFFTDKIIVYAPANSNTEDKVAIPFTRDREFKNFHPDHNVILEIHKNSKELKDQIRQTAPNGFTDWYRMSEVKKSDFTEMIRQHIHIIDVHLDQFENPALKNSFKQYCFSRMNQIWYEYKDKQDSLWLDKEIHSISEGEDGYYDRQQFALGFYEQSKNYKSFYKDMFNANLSLNDQIQFLGELLMNDMKRTNEYDALWDKKLAKLLKQFPEHKRLIRLQKRWKNHVNSRKLKTGNAFPNIVVTNIAGGKKELTDYRGKYILLDFWATWCKPCIKDQEELAKIHKKYSEDKLKILSVSTDDPETLKSFLVKKPLEWEQLLINRSALNKIGVGGFPSYFILNPAGIILYQETGGGMGKTRLKNELERHVGQ